MAAKEKQDIPALSRSLIEDARRGIFRPVYILMGDEPYYPDAVCQAIVENCIDDFGKDFNETICYSKIRFSQYAETAKQKSTRWFWNSR